MLVLTRKQNESVIILLLNGQCIEVNVSKIDNDRVKIGIDAPKSIRIFRKEVYDTVVKSNNLAQIQTEDSTPKSLIEIIAKKFRK